MTQRDSTRSRRAKKPAKTPVDIAGELLTVYDEYARFAKDCAFLCDAFALCIQNSEQLCDQSTQGFDQHARRLKHRAIAFKQQIQALRRTHSPHSLSGFQRIKLTTVQAKNNKPLIALHGQYLRKAGFTPGKPVDVVVCQDRLILRV